MVWWEILVTNWETFSVLLAAAWAGLGEATGFGEALSYFSSVLMGQFMTLLFLIFYPVIVAMGIVQSMIMQIFEPFIGLINAIFGIGNVLMGLVTMFEGVFPSPWIIAMTSIVGINIGLRILKLVGGIEILGFSIGKGV